MPSRYIRESICTSENLAQLSAEAERFWYRLLVNVDDYGRFDARLAVLRSVCFPLQLDQVTEADVAAWLTELGTAKGEEGEALLRLYQVRGKPYLEITNFVRYNKPRAGASKYPQSAPGADVGAQLPTDADSCAQLHADADSGAQIPSLTYSLTYSDSLTRAAPTAPSGGSASFARARAVRLGELNAQVPAAQRVPLVNALLDLTGLRRLADSTGPDSERVLAEAHEKAVTLWGMGYQAAEQIAALAEAWAEDWRGARNAKPTLRQVVELASSLATPATPTEPERLPDYSQVRAEDVL